MSRKMTTLIAAGLMAATTVAIPAVAHAAPAVPQDSTTQHSQTDTNSVLGTSVEFRNDTGASVWLRQYDKAGVWYPTPREVPASQTRTLDGRWPGTDDVEFRIYPSKQKALENSGYIEVDAENPAWGQPYLVVDWQEKKFSVDETHTWNYMMKSGTEFWGKRTHDTSNHKNFQLHMKKGFH